MKKEKLKTYVFIDSQNLNLSTRDLKWKLDFRKFHVYLKDKYRIEKAFLFIGYVPGNESLYTFLQECGYMLIFKPTLEYKKEGNAYVKGNVDAELVLHAMIEYRNYDKAIIVSGDGDFHCLIEYLDKKGKLGHIMIPNKLQFSALLRKFRKYFVFVSDLKKKLEMPKKTKKAKKTK